MLTLSTAFTKRVRLILLGLFVVALIPFLFGLHIKNKLENMVATLSPPPGATITLEQYHLGWLFSDAIFKIVYDIPTSHIFSDATHNEIGLKIHAKIQHGPILPKGVRADFGLARLIFSTSIDDVTGLNPEFHTELTNLLSDKELVSAVALLGFTGDLNLIFDTTAFDQAQDGDLLQWHGLTGNISVNAPVTTAKANIVTTPFLFSIKEGGILNISEIKFDAALSRTSDYPWIGTQTISIPQFYTKDLLDNELRFNNLNAAVTSQIEDEFVNVDFKITADNIVIAQQEIDKINFSVNLAHLAAKPLAKFNTLLHLNTLSGAQKVALINDAIKALNQGASATLQGKIKTPDGSILNTLEIQFPQLEDQKSISPLMMNQLLMGLQAKLTFSAPQALIKNFLIQKSLRQWRLKNKAAPSNAVKNQIEVQVKRQLNALEQNKFLILEHNFYLLDISYQQGKMTLNGQAMTAEASFALLLFWLQSYEEIL